MSESQNQSVTANTLRGGTREEFFQIPLNSETFTDDSFDFEGEPSEDDFDDFLGRVAGTPEVAEDLTPEHLLQKDLGVGAVVDERYRLLKVLGRGGFGIVYLAEVLNSKVEVALKVMLTSHLLNQKKAARAIKDFKREINLCGMLNHPHIVQMIDSGSLESGLLYMVLEYIEGETLAEMVDREGKIKAVETRRLMGQVLEALSVAHAHGIAHRDLKPQNIMVMNIGGRRVAKVLDFGIARVVEVGTGTDLGTLTVTGRIAGTPQYMPPEQLKGKFTLQSDLYAWGLIFLECLTGERVVAGSNVAMVIKRQLEREPLTIPDYWLRSSFGSMLRGSLSKSLKQRYANVEALQKALEEADLDAKVRGKERESGKERERVLDLAKAPLVTQMIFWGALVFAGGLLFWFMLD